MAFELIDKGGKRVRKACGGCHSVKRRLNRKTGLCGVCHCARMMCKLFEQAVADGRVNEEEVICHECSGGPVIDGWVYLCEPCMRKVLSRSETAETPVRRAV